MKQTSGRPVNQIRRVPRYREKVIGGCCETRDGFQQPIAVRMERMNEEIPDRRCLNNLSRIHGHDFVRKFGHNGQIVSDEYEGKTETLSHIIEQSEYFLLSDQIKSSCGLIKNQHTRIQYHGECKKCPLFHAPRKFMRV